MWKLDKRAFSRYSFLTTEVLMESIPSNFINFAISIKKSHFERCWCMDWSSRESCFCKPLTWLLSAFCFFFQYSSHYNQSKINSNILFLDVAIGWNWWNIFIIDENFLNILVLFLSNLKDVTFQSLFYNLSSQMWMGHHKLSA